MGGDGTCDPGMNDPHHPKEREEGKREGREKTGNGGGKERRWKAEGRGGREGGREGGEGGREGKEEGREGGREEGREAGRGREGGAG